MKRDHMYLIVGVSICLYDYSVAILLFFFFFNDPATTEIYTLSLHDALPISSSRWARAIHSPKRTATRSPRSLRGTDRKSTRLNSSHRCISYAVFCLKKKKKNTTTKNTNNIQ